MRNFSLDIAGAAPGTSIGVSIRRFGSAGGTPKVYIQAGLHADEVPGMLAAHHLTALLKREEEAGRIKGEILLVPVANPIGLSQHVLHAHVGRFDSADGRNFNRHYPWLAPAVGDAVAERLGPDPAANRTLIREAAHGVLDQGPAVPGATVALKYTLLRLAIGADIVLDLHCGSEAVQHVYTLTPLADAFGPMAALMGAEVLLLAEESGGDPFDEACSRLWPALQARFPQHPIPNACLAATLEFRGERDVNHGFGAADARAIRDFLILSGVIEGPMPTVPALPRIRDLQAAEPLVAPVGGMLVFHANPGATLDPGALVAEIVDPLSSASTVVATQGGGLLYTRTASRFVLPGARLGTVAGDALRRSGLLLSA